MAGCGVPMARYLVPVIATVLAWSCAGSAGAAPVTVLKAAEDCIRANAGQIAALDNDLKSATDFLVEDLCAVEVEAASRFVRNTDLISVLGAGAPNAAARFSVDPTTGRLNAPVEPGKSPTDGLGAINLLQTAFAPAVAPSLRVLAARLILEARTGGR